MKIAQHRPTLFAARPLALEISRLFRVPTGAGAALMAALAAPIAVGAPQGGSVTAGQASIRQSGSQTTINQGSQRAAIDWHSFSVGATESVNFVQPNASSGILNRVVGNDASAIFGRITANGQVYLINPNGILFGRTAQVDVGGLVASTSNITNANFMAGRMEFTRAGKPGATVENRGSITVGEGGFAALVGRGVSNSGVINARLGKVTLAAGDAFVLDLYGDQLVNLVVDPAAMATLTDAAGSPLAARVDNSGRITADGGGVQLAAATVKQLVDNIINVSGVVRATSFETSPGHISLKGDANTRLTLSGTLDTSGDVGGRIEVTARDVTLTPTAAVTAAGSSAGGNISVGGDWQGKGALAHAKLVTIDQGARIDASATSQGDGGTVAVWSDDRTRFEGRIDAHGGSIAGNGGNVEVSSKGQLGFIGDVDVFATRGRQGSLLLDPANLRISSVGSSDSEVAAEQIRFFLTRGASVTLSADQNVTVDAEINGLVAGGGVSGGGLKLTAGNDLTVNQTIALNNGDLNLTATSGTLSSKAGAVLFTGSGAVNLAGGAGVDASQLVSGGVVDIRSASGAVTVHNPVVAASDNGAAAPTASLNVLAAGAVTLNGALVSGGAAIRSTGANVTLRGAAIQSTAGIVNVQAAGGIASEGALVGLVAAGGLTVSAGQAINLATAIGAGDVNLTAGSGVAIAQTITGIGTGAAAKITVVAGGPVALHGANAGAGGISIATSSGDVTSQTVSGAGGSLVSTGPVSVKAVAGQAGSPAQRLSVQSGPGAILLEGSGGVNAANLVGTGSVQLTAGAGRVDVSEPISGASGTVNADSATRPSSISVSARDAVNLTGAVAGSGGITVNSASGAFALSGVSLFSHGPVSITTNGPITLPATAGINTRTPAGSVTLTSRNGAIVVGAGGVQTGDAGANVTLNAKDDVTLDGDVQAKAGTISVTSTAGKVTAKVAQPGTPAPIDASLDAGVDPQTSKISIQAQGDVLLGEMIAQSGISLKTDSGNVVLTAGLGGPNTGYRNFVDGYQNGLKPNVGRLVISAPAGSVELNGLNLDGNSDPSATLEGLSVTAGHRIISNLQVAVNKGDILLTSTGTGPLDGVMLGNNLYSRGYDVVRGGRSIGIPDVVDANGNITAPGTPPVYGDYTKSAYRITVAGQLLGLFDNTSELAIVNSVVPDAQPPAVTVGKQQIAKIIIGNNTANYLDERAGAVDSTVRGYLVPFTIGPAGVHLSVNSAQIAGVNVAARPGTGSLRVSDVLQPLLLQETPVLTRGASGTDSIAGLGIGLKVLSFFAAGDDSTTLTPSSLTFRFSGGPVSQRTPFVERMNNPQITQAEHDDLVNGFTRILTMRGDEFELSLDNQGNLVPTQAIASGQQYEFKWTPDGGGRNFAVEIRRVGANPASPPIDAIRIGSDQKSPTVESAISSFNPNGFDFKPGVASLVSVGARPFGSNRPVQQQSSANPRLSPEGEFEISTNNGATKIFGIADAKVSATAVGRDSGRGAPGTRFLIYGTTISIDGGDVSDDSDVRSALPGVAPKDFVPGTNNSGVGFASVGAGFGFAGGAVTLTGAGGATFSSAAGNAAPGAGAGAVSGFADTGADRSTQDIMPKQEATAGRSEAQFASNLALGSRPGAEADLGRGAGVLGPAVNTFGRRYRLATSSDSVVCAPGTVQPLTPPVAADSTALRECK